MRASVVRAIEAGRRYLLRSRSRVRAEAAILKRPRWRRTDFARRRQLHILTRMRNAPQRALELDAPPTEKEVAILTDLAKGFRYKESRALHGISPHTVACPREVDSARKSYVNSRSAVFEAVQAGSSVKD